MNAMCIVGGVVNGGWWIGKNLKGSVCGLIKVLPYHFFRRTEESHDCLS
jgi:hypothetical protein